MTSIRQLYDRREQLKAQIAEIDASLEAVRCTYCTQDMDAGDTFNTFTDGPNYAAITENTMFTCSQCGQEARLTETVIRERKDEDSAWEVTGEMTKVYVSRRGKPFIVQAEVEAAAPRGEE